MARKKPTTKAGKQAKVQTVMHEFKHGSLHSGSKKGPKVTSRDQAVAIALSQSGQSRRPQKPKKRKR
jgi:Family of unknown function (DUF6496)